MDEFLCNILKRLGSVNTLVFIISSDSAGFSRMLLYNRDTFMYVRLIHV